MRDDDSASRFSQAAPCRLVIFGANGVFGRRIIKGLATLDGLQIGAVCRTKQQAIALTQEFRPSVSPLWGDVHCWSEVRSLMDGAHAVFHCAGPFSAHPLHPLRLALEHGLHYADLGDDPRYLETAAQLMASHPLIDRIVICGASSLPSMTSLLTRIAESRYGPVERISIRMFIGNQNPKGKGIIEYLIHALRHPFQAMRNGASTPARTWSKSSTYASPFDRRQHPFSLIESPDDHFLPRWFKATDVSFQVSLEFSWIHHVICLIGLLQRITPQWIDPLWTTLLFRGHPLLLSHFGSTLGWLEVTTTHRDGSDLVTHCQQFSAGDDGQKIPSFPLITIGRALAGQLPCQTRTVTRFMDLLSIEQFLTEIRAAGIEYHVGRPISEDSRQPARQ